MVNAKIKMKEFLSPKSAKLGPSFDGYSKVMKEAIIDCNASSQYAESVMSMSTVDINRYEEENLKLKNEVNKYKTLYESAGGVSQSNELILREKEVIALKSKLRESREDYKDLRESAVAEIEANADTASAAIFEGSRLASIIAAQKIRINKLNIDAVRNRISGNIASIKNG